VSLAENLIIPMPQSLMTGDEKREQGARLLNSAHVDILNII